MTTENLMGVVKVRFRCLGGCLALYSVWVLASTPDDAPYYCIGCTAAAR